MPTTKSSATTISSKVLTFFLLLILLLSVSETAARPHRNNFPNTDSLVLGLVHSRTSLLTPKRGYFSRKGSSSSINKPMEEIGSDNVIEPLREIRDGYLISLTLGTPPQVIQVYMDTGSDLTWVPCGNLSFDCQDCEEYQNNVSGPKLAPFSPTHSSTSIRDTCGSSFCMDIHSSDNPFDPCTIAGCSLATLVKGTCPRPCPSFAYTYGASGVVTGTLTKDVILMHGVSPNSTTQIPRFCFGCVGATYREPIGIAGFGRGLLSLPSQLGFSHKGFSHCFLPFKFSNNPNFSSPLILGSLAISSKDHSLQFTPLLKSPLYPNYYYIGLESVTIGDGIGNNNSRFGVSLKLREIDTKGNGGMLIDSGTTYTHLPEPLYSQLISNLESVVTYPRAKQVEINTGFDLCYKIPCKNNTNFSSSMDDYCSNLLPSITFHFLNNVSVVLPQGNNFYAMAAPTNSTVVKCLLFQSMDGGGGDGDGNGDDDGPAGIFGSFQQQNMEVVYDLQKERIGFQTMDCASSAASQGLHKNF
ncbi:probable aspartyl protease At4g16563 [Momordica charantia]|uniref:Probable aspartyl protease At4g16563 n=1 Tax=Momordica charantia TaxID=3673 RepID=A0A6J1CMP8_MOMCH|nr:probable aspartyl protease At4g16563 [Momordica charantia]